MKILHQLKELKTFIYKGKPITKIYYKGKLQWTKA